MSQRLPQSTTVLVVGAGPIGLATAIALRRHGVDDIVIVDAEETESYGWSSRASMIHAATLEALDDIGCADLLTSVGVKGKGMIHYERSTAFTAVDISTLEPYTRFPYALLLPQSMTESIFSQHLETMGIRVYRPYRAVGIKVSSQLGGLEVTFESGDAIRANYVVGADGSHSVIREVSGITFKDPDTGPNNNTLVQQLCHADVVFSGSDPLTSPDYLETNVTPSGILMTIPLPASYKGPQPLGPNEFVRRLAFNVPPFEGVPPPTPPVEYLQAAINRKGPPRMSSDPTVNPTPVHVSRVIWSSRYKMRYAVADQFFKRITDGEGNGGLVMLVGDAGHTHSPLGGQGMNLGLRDTLFLAPILAKHILGDGETLEKDASKLEEWAKLRRERALGTIKLTKALSKSTNNVMASYRITRFLSYWAWRFISSIPFVKVSTAWRFSGLGNR